MLVASDIGQAFQVTGRNMFIHSIAASGIHANSCDASNPVPHPKSSTFQCSRGLLCKCATNQRLPYRWQLLTDLSVPRIVNCCLGVVEDLVDFDDQRVERYGGTIRLYQIRYPSPSRLHRSSPSL